MTHSDMKFAIGAVLVVAFIGWGTVSEMRGAQARMESQVAKDSIAVLAVALDSAETQHAMAVARTEMIEETHAADSVVWQAERDSILASAAEEEVAHEAIGDSIRARVDAETRDMLDRQDVIHQQQLAGRDAIIESQADEISSLNVRVASWMVRAETAEEGWDLEKQTNLQLKLDRDIWEAEAERLGNPSLLTRIRDGLPWVAAGYLGAKIQ